LEFARGLINLILIYLAAFSLVWGLITVVGLGDARPVFGWGMLAVSGFSFWVVYKNQRQNYED
jgi:hypothetical protein